MADQEEEEEEDPTENLDLAEKIRQLENEKNELQRLRDQKRKTDHQKRNSETKAFLEKRYKELKKNVQELKSSTCGTSRTSPGKSSSKSSSVSDILSLGQSKLRYLQRDVIEAGPSDSNESQEESVEDSDEDVIGPLQSAKVMSDPHKKRIQKNRAQLVENMIPDDIFNELIANKVLTSTDVKRIREKGTTTENMNEELLDTLVRKSDNSFSIFVRALKKTLQKHLADLLEPVVSSKVKKRKREAGDVNMTVGVESTQPAQLKRLEPKCSCEEVERQILIMARHAYQNIRRRDQSPAAFEQFRKELSQTNTVIKDSMEIMNTLKVLCQHDSGRTIHDISYGSIKFTIHCTLLAGLKDLWDMYTSGMLLEILQTGLITKGLKRRCRAKEIKICVRIAEEEYRQCLRELKISPEVKKNKVVKASQNIHNLDLSMESSPEPRRAFKEIHSNHFVHTPPLSSVSAEPKKKSPSSTSSLQPGYHICLRSCTCSFR